MPKHETRLLHPRSSQIVYGAPWISITRHVIWEETELTGSAVAELVPILRVHAHAHPAFDRRSMCHHRAATLGSRSVGCCVHS